MMNNLYILQEKGHDVRAYQQRQMWLMHDGATILLLSVMSRTL